MSEPYIGVREEIEFEVIVHYCELIMASKLLKIGFIGGGKMAHALAKGFISAG